MVVVDLQEANQPQIIKRYIHDVSLLVKLGSRLPSTEEDKLTMVKRNPGPDRSYPTVNGPLRSCTAPEGRNRGTNCTRPETYHADVGPGVQLLEGLRGEGLSKHLQVHPREFGHP